MEEKICPYPGLRPFNDDESIFFKGRERNIDTIIALFEQKKFMMLTGASGDGKSSLVYAGIVPHARAGLFKAKYNNWIVADFKPERTPLDNLTAALNTHFKYDDQNQLKEELSLGFSSLTKIYKNSPFFIHEEGKDWAEADDVKKKQLKRKASNLLIIADQFEEFFTNSENFIDGAASVESQTVINVLLETAKIALAEDLPIYVVCTMRSDYIGQCAAFRGLPEYIGFSQFFVPRLKRKEIQQVIEEPAQLNGDKISDRLIQRLLYDISDGLDQLPILQHALNQIWKMADNGKYEMDLIHYAKVGGLPADELPPEDRDIFAIWFADLPNFKQQLFANPSLENILNAHANELLEFSYQNFIERNPSMSDKITQEQAKTIIKTTFQCLTKIDAARAVRNRMTLQEITDIINDPSIDVKMVGKVLDIFREQGNTFIKPFITSDIHTLKTHKHTVLDITHESLIRNWDILKTWAYEEFDNWSNFQDFNKQLQRWIKSGKTSGYLLPIGPLTFFENWYNTCKPNKYWLTRYDENEHSFEEKLKHSEENLNEAQAFLKASAKKLFVTRTVMKYGANKILAIFGLIVLFGACAFYYNDYRKKQNDVVLADIEQKGLGMLRSNKIEPIVKSDFLITYERLHPGSFVNILNDLNCDTLAFDIALEMFLKCQNIDDLDKVKVNPIVYELTDYLDNTLNKIYNDKNKIKNDLFFKRFGEFVRLCAYIKSYEKKTHTSIDKLIEINVDRLYNYYITPKLNESIDSLKFEPLIFNNALELVINYSVKKEERVKEILAKISPFENENSKNKFEKLYSKNKKIGGNNEFFSHNGGYQELSYLYAIYGDYKKTISCLDSIIKYNPNYKSYYSLNFKIIGTYILNSRLNIQQKNEIFKKYENFSGATHLKLVESIINNLQPFVINYMIKKRVGFDGNRPYFNFINIISYSEADRILDYYYSEINDQVIEKDELTFKLALFYKLKGLIPYNRDIKEKESCFKKAFNYYTSLGKDFVEKNTLLGILGSPNSKNIKRSVLFLYPKSINEIETWNLFNIGALPNNLDFINYILKHTDVELLYFSKDEWSSFEIFLYNYYFSYKVAQYSKRDSLDYSYFNIAEKYVKNNSMAKLNIDSNFIYLVQSFRYFEKYDTIRAFRYFNNLNAKKILTEEFQKGEFPKDFVNKFLLKSMAERNAIYNKTGQALNLIYAFYEPYYKRNALINTSFELIDNACAENSFIFLDSIYKEIEIEPKYGLKLLQVNAMIGGQEMYKLNKKLIKEVNDKRKPRALILYIRGIAYNGLYYFAQNSIPAYISSSNELELYTEIMKAEVKKILNENKSKINMNKNLFKKYDNENLNNNYQGDLEDGYGWDF